MDFVREFGARKCSTVKNPFTPVQNQLSPIFVKIKPQKYTEFISSKRPIRYCNAIHLFKLSNFSLQKQIF